MTVVETASPEGDQNPAGVNPTDMANAIRALAMDAVEKATCGHPGMPMGMADVATVLFTQFLKYDPTAPDWPDRDRFVLSAGHGSMLLYALLYLTGYEDMTIEQIEAFRQWGSRTAGHPEYGEAPGIETTTGPLGQGLANGVGMAIAERMLNARFGDDLVDHHTYVLAGDGCLMEGISHEAISLAGHLRLGRLIVLFDDNGISIDGPTDMSVSDDQAVRFAASGWHVLSVDGHDQTAIAAAIAAAKDSDLPSLVCCRTTIGYGAPNKQGTAGAHGSKLGADEIALTREALGWPHEPFDIPGDILSHWRTAGAQGADLRRQWQVRLAAASERAEFERLMSGALPDGWRAALYGHRKAMAEEQPNRPTRKSSGEVLEVLNKAIPELAGGSADLTGSNNTRIKDHRDIGADDFSGSYIRYGVREHGMAAAMNGMALHGGMIPYGATFLVFTDYARPAIRLSALMGIRVIYVMTHDSIGLGEDGPTHQPVEHLASPARDAEPERAAARRRGGNGGVLGNGAGLGDRAFGHRAEPPEPTAGPPEPHRGQPVGAGRVRPGRRRRGAGRDPAGDRLGGLDRARGAGDIGGIGPLGRRRLDAVLGGVRPAGRGLSPRCPGRRPARRRGGGRRTGLGAIYRHGRHLCRHDAVRRIGAGRQAVRGIRHHRGSRGTGRNGSDRQKLEGERLWRFGLQSTASDGSVAWS